MSLPSPIFIGFPKKTVRDARRAMRLTIRQFRRQKQRVEGDIIFRGTPENPLGVGFEIYSTREMERYARRYMDEHTSADVHDPWMLYNEARYPWNGKEVPQDPIELFLL